MKNIFNNLDDVEKNRILEMYNNSTKNLIKEAMTLTPDDVKGLNSTAEQSEKNNELYFGFRFLNKNKFEVYDELRKKSYSYELIPPTSTPSAQLIGVNYNGCFTLRVKYIEVPISMLILKTLLTVKVVNPKTGKLDDPIMNWGSFDWSKHGYSKEGDVILQMKTCASDSNLLKFMQKLKSNNWKTAASGVPGTQLQASIKLA